MFIRNGVLGIGSFFLNFNFGFYLNRKECTPLYKEQRGGKQSLTVAIEA
jgi:hypothetical protein